MASVQFANQLGWYAFISLFILVILYLMRPRPVERNMPSLMFFMREKGFAKKAAFFKRLLNNILFLIQLLALAALSFVLTAPYTTVFGSQAIEKTAIVLDTSASMQAVNRFPAAIDAARKSLHGDASIVFAQNVPLLALEDGNREEAEKVLSSAKPGDTTTNIGDAILLAGDVMKGKTGKVVVISDFIYTEGPDPNVAKRVLLSKGIPVEFVNVGGKASNAGITDLFLGKSTTKAIVKNYDGEQKTLTLSIISEQGTKQIIKNVLPKSVETFDFATPSGSTELRIMEKDDFDADNHAYISAPSSRKIKVLLITNAEKSYLKTALQSSQDIQLATAAPPVIPSLDYDILIVHKVSPGLILPDFYQEALKKVRNGSSLIIAAQENTESIGGGLLPVQIGSELNSTKVAARIINKFTSDVDFGTAFRYYNSTPKAGVVVVADADGAAMLAIKDEGFGRIIYYGILDDFSDFKTTVSYPIFWNKLIGFLTETEDLNDYNFRTGRVVSEANRQYLDKAGFYVLGTKKVSASLLSEKESDVGKEADKLLEEEKRLEAKGAQEKRDVKFEQYLLIAAFLLMLAELLYVKWRGDF